MSEQNNVYYANSVLFNISIFDFMFNFGIRTPKGADDKSPEHDSGAVVIMSPQHAKVMAQLLNENIKRYEAANGEIKVPDNLITIEK